MSNVLLVVGGCSYRVSMVGKGVEAGQGLKGMSGEEASRVSMEKTDARKREGKTPDVEESRQVVVEGGEGRRTVVREGG